MFEEKGGVWQHNPVPGFTTEMMNKLRAQIMAGDPPAISQLKGPEIAAWSKIAPDRRPRARWCRPRAMPTRSRAGPGKICTSRPATGSRCRCRSIGINTLFMSTKGMDKAKASKPPATWAEFNEVAEKMKAAGMTPVANGGNRPDDGQKFEIALAGISPDIYRRALMKLEPDALNSKEVLAAFEQLRKFSSYMNPNIAAQPWAVNLPGFVKGDMGMVMMGGWAQGNLFKAGCELADFSSGPAPQDNGKPCFDLNADCFHLLEAKEADLDAGQKLFAEIVMESDDAGDVLEDHGLDSGAHRRRPAGEGFTDGQRNSAAVLKDAIAKNRVVLSLAHNMAQPNGITAAMIDVLTEYVHNKAITPEQAVARLAEAVEGAR